MYPNLIQYRLMTSHQTNGENYGCHRGLWLSDAMDPQGTSAGYSRRSNELLRADVERLIGGWPNMFTLRKVPGTGAFLDWDDNFDRPSLRTLTAELRDDARLQGDLRADSDFDLIAAVAALGDEQNFYGHGKWRDARNALHVLVCGFDWSTLLGVTSTQWDEFAGTFAEEQDRSDRVEVAVRCRCDREIEVEFGIVPPSVATLIVRLEQDRLDEILRNV